MKTQLLPFCVILLFVSACSVVSSTTPVIRTTQPEASQPISSPTSLPISSPIPTETASIPTLTTANPETTACWPVLTPSAFFPESEHLLGFRDTRIQIYDLKTHIIEAQIQMPTDIIKAAISPDGQTMAIGLDDFSILIVRVSDQKVMHTLNAHTANISGLAFSPTGDRLLSASEDSWVRTWSIDGQQVDAFQPSGGSNLPTAVMGIGISTDWKRLATIPFDGWMNLWSLPERTLLGSFEGSIQGGYTGSQAAFSPDGQYLAQHLGAGGGYFSLWRIADGKLLLRGENISTGIDFSPDGRYLAYGEMLPAGGGHIALRTPDGSQLIRDLLGPAGSLPGLPLFTPDGNQLVATDYASGALLSWTTADGKLLSLGEVNCPDR
jgi:WD40 repeat protein